MFKELSKGKNVSWDDVARRVYGTPERAGDIEKLNNNCGDGSV